MNEYKWTDIDFIPDPEEERRVTPQQVKKIWYYIAYCIIMAVVGGCLMADALIGW